MGQISVKKNVEKVTRVSLYNKILLYIIKL